MIKTKRSNIDLSPKEKKKGKKLYKVTVNWYGELTTIYTKAMSKSQALTIMIRKFAVKYKHTIKYTRLIITNPDKDRYKIKEVKEK